MGIGDFLNSLDDGWSIYLWLVVGAMIIIAAVVMIRWAARNEQFDEDIKYVVFDEKDQEKMSPEEFAKAKQVWKHQGELRKEYLQRDAQQKAAKQKAK
jgi:nitrogen fixation-related uncharacterized protein